MRHGRASHAFRPTRPGTGRTAGRRRVDDGSAARPATPSHHRPADDAPSHHRPADDAPSRHRRADADADQHRRALPPVPGLPRDRPLALAGGIARTLPRAVVGPVTPQRAAQFLTKSLATLIVLGVTGLIAFFIVADERRGVPAAEASTTRAGARDGGAPASRAADPTPLTLGEVFPDPAAVHRPGGAPAYPIEVAHADGDCRTAAYGTLGGLLTERGCSQVVRASLSTPYGDYQVTAGLFNLADAGGAAALDGRLRHLIETGDGSFAAMAAGAPGTPPSQVGWHSRGHYLLYCVITRPGGAVVPDDDPNLARITADLVDDYLDAEIVGKRART